MELESPAHQSIGASGAFDPLDADASPRHAFLAAGNPRTVMEAAAAAIRRGPRGVLALVLETEGSTYAGVGDMVLFDDDLQVGWLSGGCLEPRLAKRARHVADSGHIDWVEIDTRSDDDLLAGSALGCRGRLRIAMLPLRSLHGVDALIDAYLQITPAAALHDTGPDAVLVMHHDFELDREALAALAGIDIDIGFIGLLGPRRRRDDLFKLLTASQCESLLARLQSPVGLDLGGRGPQAIALSIAAQRVLVLVCDQPALERRHLDALLAGARATDTGCAATVHGDALGVPAVVPRSWFESMPAAGDRGFGSRLGRQRAAGIFQLQAPDLGTDIDIDSSEDLAKAREKGCLDGGCPCLAGFCPFLSDSARAARDLSGRR